jgi:hypothetical protein
MTARPHEEQLRVNDIQSRPLDLGIVDFRMMAW